MTGDDLTPPVVMRLLAQRLVVVAVVTLVGVLGVGVTQLTIGKHGLQPRTGRFRERVQMLIDMPGTSTDIQNQAFLQFVLKAMNEDSIVHTGVFADAISRRVNGAYSPDEVFNQMQVLAAPATPVVNIDMWGDSPQDAVALAKSAADVYAERTQGVQDSAGVPRSQQTVVEPLAPPVVGSVVDESLRARTRIVAGAVCAATVGILLALALPLPKRRDDLSIVQVSGPSLRRRFLRSPPRSPSTETVVHQSPVLQ